MKNLLFSFGIFCTTICFASTVDTIPANNRYIEYTGRIDFRNPLAPTFSYSGVSIRAYFTGTSISMIMDDDIGDAVTENQNRIKMVVQYVKDNKIAFEL